MKKWIVILSGLLVVQLCVAIAVNLTGQDYGAFEPQQQLLSYDEKTVDGLRIEAGDGHVILDRRDGRWILTEHGDFPADQHAVQRLLDKLAALEKGWPVATTSGAARRFNVAADAFERKLTLLSGDESRATLYVGTSPGFRKVHVRPEGDDAVYAVAFNIWEADVGTDAWIDKDILKLDEKEIDRIEISGMELRRDGETFRLEGLADGEQPNDKEVRALVGKLIGLRVQSLLGTEAKPEYRPDSPELDIKLVRKGGELLTYRFSKPENANHYVVKRSDFDYFFKVPDATVKSIKESTRQKLLTQTDEERVTGGGSLADSGVHAELEETRE